MNFAKDYSRNVIESLLGCDKFLRFTWRAYRQRRTAKDNRHLYLKGNTRIAYHGVTFFSPFAVLVKD
jgi:hypothetical protein